jgi:hypothetical protein
LAVTRISKARKAAQRNQTNHPQIRPKGNAMSDGPKLSNIVWIIGRKATLATNGYEYMTEPFIAFENEADADAACDMVEKVSGERPMKSSAAFLFVGRSRT